MARSGEVRELLDRVAHDAYTDADLDRLRQLVKVRGDGNTIQVGRYNVRLDNARNIHIGDQVFRGVDADVLRDVLHDVARGQLHRGSLRGFSGAIITIGMLTALGGMALFFYGLVSLMGSSPFPNKFSGPPNEVIIGFSLVVAGILVGAVGQLIRGWERPKSDR